MARPGDQHDAHVRSLAWAQFAAGLVSFTRSIDEVGLQFVAGLDHAIRQQRIDADNHLADVTKNGT